MKSIALGLPHCPWIPARAESYRRLWEQIAPGGEKLRSDAIDWRQFSDRESNKVWPRKMWKWGLESGADYFLTLQDDTVVAPNIWPALRAMLSSLPKRIVLGLSAVHPSGPEIRRQGHRFYATRSHLVGWAYLLDRETLGEFIAWQDVYPERVKAENEDQLLNSFVVDTGRVTIHPVPTLVDHDVSVESTYGNDDHTHRRATVTWHGFDSLQLESTLFWANNGNPPLLELPPPGICSWCSTRAAQISNGRGSRMCRLCVAELALGAMGVGIGGDR